MAHHPTSVSYFPLSLPSQPSAPTHSSSDSTESISNIASTNFDVKANCPFQTIDRDYTLVELGLNYWVPPQVVTSITYTNPKKQQQRNRPEASVFFNGRRTRSLVLRFLMMDRFMWYLVGIRNVKINWG